MGRKKRRLWARHGTVTGVGNWDAGESGPIFLAELIPTLLSCSLPKSSTLVVTLHYF